MLPFQRRQLLCAVPFSLSGCCLSILSRSLRNLPHMRTAVLRNAIDGSDDMSTVSTWVHCFTDSIARSCSTL